MHVHVDFHFSESNTSQYTGKHFHNKQKHKPRVERLGKDLYSKYEKY